MFNSEELIGTIEYLLLLKKCRITLYRYNLVSLYVFFSNNIPHFMFQMMIVILFY